jgi:hypothetical protein
MKRFSFLIFFVFLFFSYSKADISSDISNILNGTINASPPTYKQVGERGYVGFGSLSYRMNGSNMTIQPFSITPPKVKMGCGAIDIGMGGVSFLGFEYLVQKLQTILQAAPAFAFQLALEVFVPQVANVLAQINAIADAINSISFSACDASRVIQAVAPSIRDAIGLGKTDYAAGQESTGSNSGFWESMKQAFENTDFYQRVQTAWDNIIQAVDTLRSMFSSSTGSAQGEACVFPKGNSGVGALVSNSNAQRYLTTRVLKFISPEAYQLKKTMIGNYCVNSDLNGSGGDVDQQPDIRVSEEYMETLREYLRNRLLPEFSRSLSDALASGGSYSNVCPKVGSTYNNGITGMSYNFSYVCNLVDSMGSSIVNYYRSIKTNSPLDSTSATYINFIAANNSGYIRLLRNAALLDRPELVTAIAPELVGSIMLEVVPQYLMDVASEGCAEAMAFLEASAKSLSVAPADNPDNQAANVLITKKVEELQAKKNKVAQFCSSLLTVLNSSMFSELQAKGIQDHQTLMEVVKKTDDELAGNLKRRGLDVLFKYTSDLR